MARARGGIYRTWQLERCPFLAEVELPGGGLGTRLDRMRAWLREHCGADYATAHRIDKSDPMKRVEWVQFRFTDEATARDFAATFGVTYRGNVPYGKKHR